VDVRDLDPAVRSALRGLDPRNAERVTGHLVAAGTLVDEDPEAALAHARAARDRASRVAAVREAVGVAAYHAGDYAEAAREIRAYRRMSGDQGYRAVLADCERALQRPDVALRLVSEALAERPGPDELVELRLVEAGARRDLGEDAAARLVLEGALGGGRPDPRTLTGDDEGRLRLAEAYAELLGELGETELAQEWLAAVASLVPEEPDVEFGEEEIPDGATPADGTQDTVTEDTVPEDTAARSRVPERVERLPEDDEDSGPGFAAEVEAEVAELLGETDLADEDRGH
jgi:tetratricopeptide (TPR) repeat protein